VSACAAADRTPRDKSGALDADQTGGLETSARLVADSHTVAAWTLASRITGFGRVATMAAILGPTYFGNLVQSSVVLPSMIFALLGGSLVNAMLVPPLVRWIDAQDPVAARRLAGGFLGLTTLALSLVVALCAAGAPLILMLITAAVDDAQVRDQQQQVGWPLLLMILPQVLLYCLAATAVAVQHAYRRFAIAAAAPIFENLGVIAIFGISGLVFGVGRDVHGITTPQLVLLGTGTTAAVALHAGAQWWGAYRVGVALVPRAGWREPEIRRMIWPALRSSGYTGLYNLVYFAALVVAGKIPGATIAFQIGQNFLFLVVALGAAPFAAAQLPRLSRSINEERAAAFQVTLQESLALTRFVTLPMGLFLFAVAGPLARAVAFGEMAGFGGIAMITVCIASLGIGAIGEATMVVLTSASYARRDALAPLRAMLVRFAVALVGMAIALTTRNEIAALAILGGSVSAANLLAAGYLHWRVVYALPGAGLRRRAPVFRDLLAAAAATVPALLVSLCVGSDGAGHAQKLWVALATIALSGGGYLLLQRLRGSLELNLLLSGLPTRRCCVAPATSCASAPRAAKAAPGGTLS
jgi:putative peptidoglycan lipid II flippase